MYIIFLSYQSLGSMQTEVILRWKFSINLSVDIKYYVIILTDFDVSSSRPTINDKHMASSKLSWSNDLGAL